MDVQSFMKISELYLIERCRSNEERLGYVKTRTEHLKLHALNFDS